MRAVVSWLVVCSLLAGGCSTFRFAPPEPVIYSQAGAYTDTALTRDLADYKSAAPGERKAIRDKMILSTAAEIDKAYATFKNSFFGERAATETVIDIALIGLGAAGTLAGGETAKAILAAIATGVTASRLSFNKNFFKEKTPDLLLTRMDALRAEQWATIYGKLKAIDQDYSWWEAERDLVAYYQAGTLEAAFQNIIVESGAIAKKAQDQIQREIAQKFGPEAGEIDRTDNTKEVMALYKEWRNLKDKDKERARASKIVAAFKRRMPEYVLPSIAQDASDQLATIYVCAIQKNPTPACVPATVREALVASFKDAPE